MGSMIKSGSGELALMERIKTLHEEMDDLTAQLEQAKAEISSLNSQIQIGIVNITIPANANASVPITFITPFPSIPTVFATILDSEELPGIWGYYTICAVQLKNTGCTIAIHSLDSIQREMRVCWMAISK